jgi:hypothetical protein
MKNTPQAVLPFHEFCGKVLNLKLTPGQTVIAKVAFGDQDPGDLEGEEKELALQMFGGLEKVDHSARKYVVLRLGRGSGKTTLCSAFAVYTAVTFDIAKCGPGDVPYVIVIAPDKATAQLSIRMAREMVRSQPALERLVVSDTSELIQLRRPDGRMVRIEAFAATRGGSALRGRTIIAFLMDEAEFFTSNSSDGGRDYAVNDRDIFRALKPRLLPAGKGMLISTPWPVETLMGEMFTDNWGKCLTAVAIKAPTILVRGNDPDVAAMVEDELQKDPENARRELFCEVEGLAGEGFFDASALHSSICDVDDWPTAYNPSWPVAVGCDLGFTRDSSAVAVVQFDGQKYRLVYAEELKPKPGKPLKPGYVVARFAEVSKKYGAKGVIADAHYRMSLHEHLEATGLSIWNAPATPSEAFTRTRAVLHEGRCTIPRVDIGKRMLQQAKLVTSKASPGGKLTIKIPRRVGLAHGDIVSAWVLAVHHLAFKELEAERREVAPGTDEWYQESQRRLVAWQEKQQRDYLKNLEKEARAGLGRGYLKKYGFL